MLLCPVSSWKGFQDHSAGKEVCATMILGLGIPKQMNDAGILLPHVLQMDQWSRNNTTYELMTIKLGLRHSKANSKFS